jgi:hypothetical protein
MFTFLIRVILEIYISQEESWCTMRCAICGRVTQELKSDMCFRCFVISRAIRLEPDLPSTDFVRIKNLGQQPKQSGFVLKPFVTDLHVHKQD